MAKRRYEKSEPTRRAVGPAARRIQPGRSLIGTRAVAAGQTSRPAGQERAGMQSHAGASPQSVAPQSWENMGMWDRAADWTRRTGAFAKYLGETIVAGTKKRNR